MALFENQNNGFFPASRLRRLRYHSGVRRLTRDTILSPDRFVIPLFVRPGEGVRQPIAAMPGQFQFSLDELVKEVVELEKLCSLEFQRQKTLLEATR